MFFVEYFLLLWKPTRLLIKVDIRRRYTFWDYCTYHDLCFLMIHSFNHVRLKWKIPKQQQQQQLCITLVHLGRKLRQLTVCLSVVVQSRDAASLLLVRKMFRAKGEREFEQWKLEHLYICFISIRYFFLNFHSFIHSLIYSFICYTFQKNYSTKNIFIIYI